MTTTYSSEEKLSVYRAIKGFVSVYFLQWSFDLTKDMLSPQSAMLYGALAKQLLRDMEDVRA